MFYDQMYNVCVLFQRPVLQYLNGEVDATKYGSPCLQWQYSNIVGDEDCLYLNVQTPSVSDHFLESLKVLGC